MKLKFEENLTEVVISIVACGLDRAQEALNSVKSALLFSEESDRLKFIIFTDTQHTFLDEQLAAFQGFRNFSFVLKNVSFPVRKKKMWKKMWKPCAAQRLFFPELLPEIDALIYVDSDTLFLTSPRTLFEKFQNFNESQIAALAPEMMNNDSWYPQDSFIPYYGKFGVNSGVKLMNLTRMREVYYQERLINVYWDYKKDLTYPDQDIM